MLYRGLHFYGINSPTIRLYPYGGGGVLNIIGGLSLYDAEGLLGKEDFACFARVLPVYIA